MRLRHTLFVISCAVVALIDRVCGRQLAINAATDTPPDPSIAVGLPTGLSSTAVAARVRALVAAGTPPIYAQKFAIDAEQQQAWHDNPKQRDGAQANPRTPAEDEAAAIAAAQKLDPSKLKAPSDKDLEAREAAVLEAQAAAERMAGSAASDREAADRTLAEARRALDEAKEARAAAEAAANKGGKK